MRAVGGIAVGDLLQLCPRRSPHEDRADWWWEVVELTDIGFDCVYPYRKGPKVRRLAVRRDVSEACIRRLAAGGLAHRRPDEAA